MMTLLRYIRSVIGTLYMVMIFPLVLIFAFLIVPLMQALVVLLDFFSEPRK
jgi:hypothetical protein